MIVDGAMSIKYSKYGTYGTILPGATYIFILEECDNFLNQNFSYPGLNIRFSDDW